MFNQRSRTLTRSSRIMPLPCFLLGILLGGLTLQVALEPVASAQAATCTGTQITGIAFRDYNANGAKDSGEPGLAGIVVTAFAANGTATACETTTNGTYAIDPTGAFPVRLEFTLPTDGRLNFLRPGVKGSASATTVVFVQGPSSNIDVGYNNPAHYCGADSAPELAVSCYVFGEQNNNPDGVNKNLDVLVSFPYQAGSTDLTNELAVRSPTPSHRAFAKEIGSVWGLAWNAQNQTLYAAAFLKRHAGFGPDGPGAIYQLNASGPHLFYNFGALAGVDPHPQPGTTCLSPGHNNLKTNGNCWLNDSNAFDQVGKIGFGDLEISEDAQTLYTINLATKALLSIPVNNPAAARSIPVPTPLSCPAADLRPFGIGVNDGVVYIGLVCSAESTQNINQLRGYVYAYTDGVFKSTPTLDFPLTYDRGMGTAQWAYWLNRSTFNPNDARQKAGKWAQPLLTDITFDQGNMVLALRDRNGDQFGSIAGGPDPADPNNYSAVSRGDILRACAVPGGLPNTAWLLEQNGKCGQVTTAGAGDGEGPNGGEYYFQDQQFSPLHSETSLGSQFQVPGSPDVASVIFNPIEGHSAVSDGGIKWYANGTGTTTRSYLIFDASSNPALFQKASGLGDLVALCPPSPIEIGNRVWLDSDKDGIQDPNEQGIDQVSIELYRQGILVGATTTTNGGQYYFNDANVKLHGANGIFPGTQTVGGDSAYEVRIPNAQGSSQQVALAGLALTLPNHDPTANGDLRDSDGVAQGDNASFTIPQADLLAPGYNNHTYDFGFNQPATPTVTPTPTISPTPTASPTPSLTPSATATGSPTLSVTPPATPAPQQFSLGNLVWNDQNNNGFVDEDEFGIAGVTVKLYQVDNNGAQQDALKLIGLMVTNRAGYYLFTGLNAGAYRVAVEPPFGYSSSTGAGYSNAIDGYFEAAPAPDDDATDNDDNGTMRGNETWSGLVTLTLDGEPRDELATPGLPDTTPDGNANYTVDFGFFELPTALDEEKQPQAGHFVFLPLLRKE